MPVPYGDDCRVVPCLGYASDSDREQRGQYPICKVMFPFGRYYWTGQEYKKDLRRITSGSVNFQYFSCCSNPRILQLSHNNIGCFNCFLQIFFFTSLSVSFPELIYRSAFSVFLDKCFKQTFWSCSLQTLTCEGDAELKRISICICLG